MIKTTKQIADELLIEFSECGEDNEMYIDAARKVSILCVQKIIESLTISTGHLTLNQVGEYELVKDFNYWNEVLNHLKQI